MAQLLGFAPNRKPYLKKCSNSGFNFSHLLPLNLLKSNIAVRIVTGFLSYHMANLKTPQ